jgi:biotin transport system permease protein
MAALTIFHYIPRRSFVHRMDGRIKLICMIAFSIAVSVTDRILNLGIFSLLFLMVLWTAKLPLKKFLSELKYFLVLILLVFLVQSFSIPGSPITRWPLANPTREGVYSGIQFGWHLILLISLSLIVTATTTLTTIKNAVEWFLRPIPFVPDTKVGTMISLTFTLVPLVFDQASEMLDAQKARCIAGRKNPVSRIIFLVFPLLLQTFRRADEMVYAMESRCYSDQRTPMVFKTGPGDWIVLIFAGLVCGMILLQISLGF